MELVWKYTKLENPDFKCKKCQSNNVKYRMIEDYLGHEDIHYICEDCKYDWWVEGIDY